MKAYKRSQAKRLELVYEAIPDMLAALKAVRQSRRLLITSHSHPKPNQK